MKTQLRNKISMYESVRTILNNYEPIWSSTPKFASAVLEFNAELENIHLKSVTQQSIVLGVTSARKNMYLALTDDLNLVVNALFVYAIATNQYELAARNKIPVSTLKSFSVSFRLILIDQVKSDLDTHAVELVEYGITPAYRLSFDEKVEHYRSISNSPRMKMIERKGLTSDLSSHATKIDHILKLHLDKLIIQFKTVEPRFIQAYTNARLIVDLRGPTSNQGGVV